MRQLLLGLAARGKTLMVTSHILPELARICDRVAIITGGKLRAFGTLDEITRQLSQLQTMEVLLARPDAVEPAAEIVRGHVEPDAAVTPSQAELAVRFRTAKSEEELAALLTALVAANLGVTQFREVQTDLEEAFLTVARNEEMVGVKS
jgi:ABC-2 type transport system ATP-binding protein